MDKALVLLSCYDERLKNVVSATLAWACEEAGIHFDVYYDSYHLGSHFGGNKHTVLPYGRAHGSTVIGGDHYRRFYQINSEMDIDYTVLGHKQPMFVPSLISLNKHIVVNEAELPVFYYQIFNYLNIVFPSTAYMLNNLDGTIMPEDADIYMAPEIFYKKSLGLKGPLTCEQLLALLDKGIKVIYGDNISQEIKHFLTNKGVQVINLDLQNCAHDYFGVSLRSAEKWSEISNGYMVGDPVLASYWFPWCCERKVLPIYSQPQTRIIKSLRDKIHDKQISVVYGRQFDDEDFTELSQINVSFQIVDPLRPVFPNLYIKSDYAKNIFKSHEVSFSDNLTDEQLLKCAIEGKILSSLIFCAGAIRELENIYYLIDLVGITKLKAGVTVTAESYEYGYPLLQLLNTPIEQGGVFPYLEPLLESTGLGVALEGYFSPASFDKSLTEAFTRLQANAPSGLVPTGWYAMLDSKLTAARSNSAIRGRPYAGFRPGKFDPAFLPILKKNGVKYAVSKSNFGRPAVLSKDDNFVVVNHTAGRWEGWSPFIDIARFSDLVKSELKLAVTNEPGWLLSTVDASLWLYTYPHWERSSELKKIADFLVGGGRTGKIINVTPATIARYSRLLIEKGFFKQNGDSTWTGSKNFSLSGCAAITCAETRKFCKFFPYVLKRIYHCMH